MLLQRSALVLCSALAMLVTSGTACRQSCYCPAAHMIECSNLENLPPAEDMANFTYILFKHCDFPDLIEVPYTNAETLIFHSSLVQSIADDAFAKMTYLEQLDLTSNEIEYLRPEMFNGLEQLTKLMLSSNRLTKIEERTFSTLPKLEVLYLNDNENLQLDDDAFTDQPELTHVNIIGCKLTKIPVVPLSKIPLTELNINRNPLKVIEDNSLAPLASLTALHLDSCDLTEVSASTFTGLTKLEVLDLGVNNIAEIPEDAFGEFKNTLRYFDCHHNQLTELSTELLLWNELTHVTLGHNPWYCGNCSVEFMMEITTQDQDNCTCAAPVEVKGKQITDVDSETLCPGSSDDGGNNMVVLAIVIPIVIICVLLVGYYLVKIIQSRRRESDHKKVRYSAVYKDTTEATPKGSTPTGTSNRPTSDL